MTADRTKELLRRHEGLRLKPYRCSSGKLTIGYGRNLEDEGISEREAEYLLTGDLIRCVGQAQKFPWYDNLSPARRDVIVSMIFQMGLQGFKGFKMMISALSVGNYSAATREMLNSKWAKQTPERAEELSEMMRTGFYKA